MNLGCLLWVIILAIILWNISPALVITSALIGVVLAIGRAKGNKVGEDEYSLKDNNNCSSRSQLDSFLREKKEEKYNEIKRKNINLEESYEPQYKYFNNLTSSTDDIDTNDWDSSDLPMDKIFGTWKYKDIKPIRTVIINSNMTYSDSITTKKKSYPFIVEGKHICFYGEDGKLLSSWKIIELSKNNVLHVILKHYFSGDMFKSLNRPFDMYLEKMGDSLV